MGEKELGGEARGIDFFSGEERSRPFEEAADGPGGVGGHERSLVKGEIKHKEIASPGVGAGGVTVAADFYQVRRVARPKRSWEARGRFLFLI